MEKEEEEGKMLSERLTGSTQLSPRWVHRLTPTCLTHHSVVLQQSGSLILD